MYFTKMQANGNDYIYVDLFVQSFPEPQKAARTLSDRHFGIGGDGIVLICPSEIADFRMRIFDPDGTEAEMCGNALQSAGVLYAQTHAQGKRVLHVETLAGIRKVFLTWREQSVREVSAEIGAPTVSFTSREIQVNGQPFFVTAVSFGNPHCVVFTDDLSDSFFATYGPILETHPLFPARTNVEFVSVTDRCHFRMRTWERGCGETLSCSTGSAAAVVAAVTAGLAETEVLVMQRGGNILVRWNKEKNSVRIHGRTQIVFEGNYQETEQTV